MDWHILQGGHTQSPDAVFNSMCSMQLHSLGPVQEKLEKTGITTWGLYMYTTKANRSYYLWCKACGKGVTAFMGHRSDTAECKDETDAKLLDFMLLPRPRVTHMDHYRSQMNKSTRMFPGAPSFGPPQGSMGQNTAIVPWVPALPNPTHAAASGTSPTARGAGQTLQY